MIEVPLSCVEEIAVHVLQKPIDKKALGENDVYPLRCFLGESHVFPDYKAVLLK